MATWWIGITHEGHAVADLTEKLQRASNLSFKDVGRNGPVNDGRYTLQQQLAQQAEPLDQRRQRSVAAGPFSFIRCACWGFEATGVFDGEAR